MHEDLIYRANTKEFSIARSRRILYFLLIYPSNGTIEADIKGKDLMGQSLIGNNPSGSFANLKITPQ